MSLEVFEKIKVKFEQKIAQVMSKMRIPGLAIAMIKDNQVIYRRGFGTKDLENNVPKKRPITPDTKLEIGSCSKSFTSLAIMQLHEQGKLDVKDPVKKHLKWFQLGIPGNPITIHHLLTHSSGIPSLNSGLHLRLRHFNSKNAPPMIPTSTKEDIILYINSAQDEILFKPGEKSFYCNMGFDMLGMIIEEVSGEEYEKYIHNHILIPLNMKTSFFPSEEPIEGITDISVNYEIRKGQLVRAQRNLCQPSNPSGGLISSVNEVSNYMIALINGGKFEGKQIITPESMNNIYGWGNKTEFFFGNHIIHHVGGTGAATSYMAMVPEKKIGLVAVTNSQGGPQLFLAYHIGLISLLGKDPLDYPDYFNKEAKIIRLEGEYTNYQGVRKITIKKSGGLLILRWLIPDLGKIILIPDESDPKQLTYFMYSGIGEKMKILFLIDGQGKIHVIYDRFLFHKIS